MGDIHPGHVGIARAGARVAADGRLLQRQRLGGRGEGQVQGVRHGAVGELAGMHVEPVAQVHVIQQCLDRADDVRGPLLMHFGARDSHIPRAAVRQIAERFDARDEVELHVYPEAEHGFNCNHRSSYHQRSAAEAHGHTLLFLSEHQ